MQQGNVELGFSYKSFHRNFDEEFDTRRNDAQWWYYTLYSKYGLWDWLTAEVAGFVFKYPNSLFPERNYLDYSVGLGFEARIYEIKNFQIISTIHYGNNYDHDRSRYQHDKYQISVFAGVGIEQTIHLSLIDISIFLTPAFVYDQLIDDSPMWLDVGHSIDNFGVAMGCNLLILKKCVITGELVYADYLQQRLHVGYQF